MNEQSSAELEREAERVRARVADTAETIKSRLSAGQLIDEFTGMFSSRSGSGTLGSMTDHVRDNPVAVALVATGLAWLALGPTRSDWVAKGMARETRVKRSGKSMASAATDAATSAKDRVTEAGASAADKISKAASSSADYVENMSEATSDYLRQAGRSASDLFEKEPLILAGLGLALGTAIGAMLPVSRFEQEEFGEEAEHLRQQAEDAVMKGVEEVKDVAGRAYEAMTEEADRQGLKPAGAATLVDRASEVVKSTAEATEEAIQEKLGGSKGETRNS